MERIAQTQQVVDSEKHPENPTEICFISAITPYLGIFSLMMPEPKIHIKAHTDEHWLKLSARTPLYCCMNAR